MFLNTKGTNDAEVPRTLVNLLHYVENSTDTYVCEVNDPVVSRLHENVRALKRSRDWEARYMLFQELMEEQRQEGLQEGLKEGLQEGRDRILRLMEAMKASGEAGQIPRLSGDREFLEAMLVKYGLQEGADSGAGQA